MRMLMAIKEKRLLFLNMTQAPLEFLEKNNFGELLGQTAYLTMNLWQTSNTVGPIARVSSGEISSVVRSNRVVVVKK
jgi:hypothetical protein